MVKVGGCSITGMAVIKLSKPYSMSRNDLDDVLKMVADRLHKEAKLEHKWEGDVINFHRRGVKGELYIREAQIDLEIRLGILASTVARPLKQEIERYMDELIL